MLSQFRGGWRGLGYRFLAVARSDEEWRDSILLPVDVTPYIQRADEEDALFRFFTASVSVVDCVAFAAFAAGALHDPDAFPIVSPKDQRGVNLASAAAALAAGPPPGRPLAAALRSVQLSKEYQDLALIRNALAHRSAPGRLIRLGGEDPSRTPWGSWPAEWQLGVLGHPDLELSPEVTAKPRRWLGGQLGSLIEGVRQLVLPLSSGRRQE